MTQEQWLSCREPVPLLRFLLGAGRASERKLRLFACACCRRIWDLLPDPRNRDLVAAVEDHPDGTFDDPDLDAAITASSARGWEFGDRPAYWAAKYLGRGFYKMTAGPSAVAVALHAASAIPEGPDRQAEIAAQADLLREIFGPLPFRPVTIDASVLAWNDRTVVRLAQGIDDERAFHRMGVLADALLDAGCDNEDVLSHCRQQGGHVRGCFVLDLLLNKP
jgi:hypothetical protein